MSWGQNNVRKKSETTGPEGGFLPLGGASQVDAVQDRGFLWFELLITASYLGVASALFERVLLSGRGSAAERVAAAGEWEAGMAAVEGVAQAMSSGEQGNDELARMLLVRYAVQGAVDRATALSVELLGGIEFIRSPEISYLAGATRPLAVHPPKRSAAAAALDAHLAGNPLVLG